MATVLHSTSSLSRLDSSFEGTIELAMPTLTRPYRASLATAIIQAAKAHGYHINLAMYQSDSDMSIDEYLAMHRDPIDGMLLYPSVSDHVSSNSLNTPYPIVYLGAGNTWGLADQVLSDNIADAYNATSTLINRGSTHFVVIGSQYPFNLQHSNALPNKSTTTHTTRGSERILGICKALQEYGLQLPQEHIGITHYDWTIGAGLRCMLDVDSANISYDAVIALNDQLAIGAVAALLSLGKRIPEDVQVIGFDNTYDGEHMFPAISSVDGNIHWIAQSAVDLLISRIHGLNTPHQVFMQPSSLILRNTTR